MHFFFLYLLLPTSAMKSGSLLIDASTVDPIFAGRIAAQATAFGANMVDAPVSGGMCKAIDRPRDAQTRLH